VTKLSVNINKVATIRNARGGNNPNLIQVAKDCESFGAQGITVHPRPDQRHIRYADVYELKQIVTTEFNIEGNTFADFDKLVLDVKPEQVTLVPDADDAITSNAGWDTKKHLNFLKEKVQMFKEAGIRVSIFLDPKPELIETAIETGADRIELYTEPYAIEYLKNKEEAIKMYKETAELAISGGLEINAGHDLDLHNLAYFHQNIKGLKEVSIGHALICDALYYGLHNTIQLYLRQLKG
jgi:pyridoxine 5-phosphate synthase